jgi:lipopolysaccharide transport system permease protein
MKETYHKVIEPPRGWGRINWAELWHYRDLFYFMVWRQLKALYKQTVLGFTWAVINPFFQMVVFSVVFGRLARIPSDGIPYPIFTYTALLPWTYFAGSLTTAADSLTTTAPIFTKVYFPRLIIPVTPLLAKLVDFALAFTVLGGLMVWYRVVPSWQVVFLPLLVLLMVLTALGLSLWLSALGLQYRDVRFGVPFLTQVMMYAAPVVWPVSLVPEKYRLLYGLYPMAGVIEGFRAALLGRGTMPWDLIAVGGASALVLAVGGLLFFARRERFFADVA